MKIYIICSVREADPEETQFLREGVKHLREMGHEVFFPPDDAPQDDCTGRAIVETEFAAIRDADEIHVHWDVNSKGSHFDLGIAYALGKNIIGICMKQPDNKGKSYWKAVLEWRPMFCRACEQSEDECRANKVCENSLDKKHDVGVVHYFVK